MKSRKRTYKSVTKDSLTNSTKAKEVHGDTEVRDALRWIAGILDYSQIQFVILGDLVEKLVNNKLAEVPEIELGVKKEAWNETTKSLLRTFLLNTQFKGIDMSKGLVLEDGGVPIKVRIIENNYEFFKNPDFVYFWTDQYLIPNPWLAYYEQRDKIK